ncbi:MAG TPA: hypothetical protein VLG36_03045 [Candidatus Chromulinivoraceae bacterium]|nr:hypothetical protein [Candidatus Chromulinivoraceae bacterium]
MSEQKHEHILHQLFTHPVARNIKWAELIAALSTVGDLQVEKNGSYRLTRGGHTLVLEARGKDVDVEEILKLRHFLESSETPDTIEPDLINTSIVAIDHHQAVIYHNPGTKMEPVKLHANLTEERILHSHPTTAPFHEQSPLPEKDYFESVVKEMAKSERIVVLSHGTGTSNAGLQLMDVVHKNHPELENRVVAMKDCDLEAMTDPELVKLGIESLQA